MTNQSPILPENVYPFPTMPPGPDDADQKDNVLWFHPAHGWMQGWWRSPALSGSTHWTYCPTSPPVQEPQEDRCNRLFASWIESFSCKFDDSAKSLMKMGWDGAFKKLQELP